MEKKINHDFFEKISCGALVCKNDPYSTIIKANSAFYKMVGYTEKEMIQQFNNRFSSLVIDDLDQILQKVNHAVNSNNVLDYEFRIRTKSGNIMWIHDVATYDSEQDVFNIVIMDITYREHLLNYAYKLSEIDTLSGLLNRGALEKTISNKINTSENLSQAMILIDLDNFKYVNDTLGHQVGDDIIVLVGEKLKKIFFNNEVVGRLGGDEFLIYMNDISKNEVEKYIELIKKEMNSSADKISIESSIGVVFDNFGKYNFTELYKFADIALYNVKNNKKGNFFLKIV
ncbi:MAG: sensor domain-containing diguanylate cyclase [Fusobacteriaceae bacterium]